MYSPPQAPQPLRGVMLTLDIGVNNLRRTQTTAPFSKLGRHLCMTHAAINPRRYGICPLCFHVCLVLGTGLGLSGVVRRSSSIYPHTVMDIQLTHELAQPQIALRVLI